MITIHPKAETLTRENNFSLFRHEGFLCCVVRMGWGNINGYVAIDKAHPFFGKKYSDKIKLTESPQFNGNYIGLLCHSLRDNEENEFSIDLALTVHGGITYSEDSLNYIEKDLFGELWWFGFDTAHAGDVRPFQDDISRRFQDLEDEYRSFDYVKEQAKKLAEQLKVLAQIN